MCALGLLHMLAEIDDQEADKAEETTFVGVLHLFVPQCFFLPLNFPLISLEIAFHEQPVSLAMTFFCLVTAFWQQNVFLI